MIDVFTIIVVRRLLLTWTVVRGINVVVASVTVGTAIIAGVLQLLRWRFEADWLDVPTVLCMVLGGSIGVWMIHLDFKRGS